MGAHRVSKAIILFFAAFMQGINVAIYPAAANLLTNPKFQGLSAHEYGSLFIPMIFAALIMSYFGGIFERHLGQRAIFASALFFNALTVLFFALTALTLEYHELSYIILLIALLFYGLGFGSMLSSITPYLLQLFPKYTHASTVAVYGGMCLGAALSPIFFHAFHKAGMWWLDPLLAAGCFFLLYLLTFAFFPVTYLERKEEKKERLPLLFWLFFLNMLVYGLISTLYGNWITIYLHEQLKFTTEIASYGLAIFWGTQLLGRVIIVGGNRWIPPRWTYIVMPILMLIATLLIPVVHQVMGNYIVFGIAGFSFAASFPLTYSFSADTFPEQEATVAGRVTAAYIIGYGIAAYGAGFLIDYFAISLQAIFFYSFVLALVMLLLSISIVRNPALKG